MGPIQATFVAFAAVLALLCAGCDRPVQSVLVPVAVAAEGTSRVPILVVTTRRRSSDPAEMFTGERGDQVSYATVTVSIPPDNAREIGKVQWPVSPPGDPNRDFVTVSTSYLDKQSFHSTLSAAAKQSGRKNVLVFVHGFNTRFDDAVYRFAQIMHDSKSPAIPVLFTWPSRGEIKLRAYTYDRESANYSRDALEELLDTLSSDPSVADVNIVAHSMGNWVTLEALRGRSIRLTRAADPHKRTSDKNKPMDKVKYALLVAPDVDVDVFRQQIHRMGPNRPTFALFLSQDDKALALSGEIWGGIQRMGEIDPNQEPYRSELARDQIQVYDLTKLRSLGSDAHGRAFDDITTVVDLIKQRNPEEFRRGAAVN